MSPILLTAGVQGECIQSLFRFASESADSDKHVIAKRSNCDREEVLFHERLGPRTSKSSSDITELNLLDDHTQMLWSLNGDAVNVIRPA